MPYVTVDSIDVSIDLKAQRLSRNRKIDQHISYDGNPRKNAKAASRGGVIDMRTIRYYHSMEDCASDPRFNINAMFSNTC